jgi:PST family polysaccharide transporter
MLNLFKNFKRKNKVLIQNFSSLTILQISQYVFPLITFPYLVRVLSPSGYGLVAFANAFIMYFTVLTDYGFNLSATKDISINRKDKKKISEIYSSVLTVRMLLFLLSVIIIIPLVLFVPKFYKDAEIYLISFIAVLGTTIFPVWFFQGIEKMKFITIISVSVKALWVLLVFLIVNTKSDIVNLVILNAGSSVLIGLISISVISIKFNVKYKLPSLESVKEQFIEGWHYFLSSVSISLYTNSATFILGLFTSDAVVGYFSAADRIRNAVQNISAAASRTVFPHLSSEFQRSKEAALGFIRKYSLSVGSFMFIISILLFLFAKQIVFLVLGTEYNESIIILKIISFLPMIIFLSNVAGIQTMVNMGYKREFANIIFLSGVFSIVMSIILVPLFFAVGTAITLVLTEILVTTQMIFFLKKKNISVFKKVVTE